MSTYIAGLESAPQQPRPRGEGLSVVLAACGAGLADPLRCVVGSLHRQTAEPEVVVAEQAVPGKEQYRALAEQL